MKATKMILLVLVIPVMTMARNVPALTMESLEVAPPKFILNEEIKTSSSIHSYILKNLDYSALSGIQYEGTSVLEFMVDKSGELSNFIVINTVSKDIDREILKQLKASSGFWSPGKLNGIPVSMHHEIAIKISPYHESIARNTHNLEDIARIYSNKGVKKLLLKRNAKGALHCFESAVRYKPFDQSLLMMRALCRLELGELNLAEEDLTRIRKLGGSGIELLVMAENLFPALADTKNLLNFWQSNNNYTIKVYRTREQFRVLYF